MKERVSPSESEPQLAIAAPVTGLGAILSCRIKPDGLDFDREKMEAKAEIKTNPGAFFRKLARAVAAMPPIYPHKPGG